MRERENTNQKLIDFYNKVYNDLKAQQFSASDVEKKIQLLNTLSTMPGIHSDDFEDNLTDRVKDLVSSIIGSLN